MSSNKSRNRSLTIFHYHLARGGVTTVIALSLRALSKHLDRIDRITVVSGRRNESDSFSQSLPKDRIEGGPEIRVEVCEEIDYLASASMTRGEFESAADQLGEVLLDRYRDSIWWVHNYHIGKNPVFTESILRIAHSENDQPMLLHIHDFPECARYENLATLDRTLTLPMYPISPQVKYAVINERDRSQLVLSGIPENSVFLLSNPVDARPVDRSGAAETKELLHKHFHTDFPRFDPSLPLLLYPIRTIRRKNVLEAMLISNLADFPVNLVITLPGVSEPERDYSDLAASLYRSGRVRGLWGIGDQLEAAGVSFSQLIASSDMIVSTSIQEGFGFLFVDTMLWGLPLFAREIDVLMGIRDLLDDPSVEIYDRLDVPVSKEVREDHRARYRRRVDAMRDTIGPIADELYAKIDTMFQDDSVDFSYLDSATQAGIVATLVGDSELIGQTRLQNGRVLNRFAQLIDGSVSTIAKSSEERFTFEGFAETTGRVVRSFGEGSYGDGSAVKDRLVKEFAKVEYIRLLYE